MARPFLLVLLGLPLGFGACTALIDPSAGFAAANVASVVAFGRAVPDILVSAVRGQDCSVVRLERGDLYCRAPDPASIPRPFCTRTLADVMCWADPAALADRPRGIADGPLALTPAQLAHGTPRFPDL